MNVRQNKQAKTIVKDIIKSGTATDQNIATLHELVKTGDGSADLKKQVDELERLLKLGCVSAYGLEGEERHEIREKAKEIMDRLKREAGRMNRKERIDFVGKNKHPADELDKMAKAQREANDRRTKGAK